MLNHYIVTWFNLGRNPDKALNAEWLRYRFTLFERFTLPSIQIQTSKAFQWFVLFDDRTPAEFRQRITRHEAMGLYVPVFQGPKFSVQNLRERFAGDWIITTRLDSDDAIERTFVERLQDAATTDRQALNFSHGWKWTRPGWAHRHRHLGNPFISLVEPNENPVTVFAQKHSAMGKVAPVRQIGGRPGWCIVCHGENMLNRIHVKKIGPPRFKPESRMGGFHFEGAIPGLKERSPTAPDRQVDRDGISAILRDPRPSIAVETGTLHGKTTRKLSSLFERVVTIELSPELYAAAAASMNGNITCVHGDSAIEVPKLAAQIREPVLWYLDAHWFATDAPVANSPIPIWDELNAILARPYADTIIVDDVHAFGGSGWEDVTVESIRGYCSERMESSEVRGDQLVVRMKAGSLDSNLVQ